MSLVTSIYREYPPNWVVTVCRFIGLSVSKVLWRISFSGVENIPETFRGGVIIASNHQSYFDPVWICIKVKARFRFMAWDEVFKWFFVGKLIRFLGAFPVGLNRRGFVQATRKARQVLTEGAALIIFPEAEREFSDGKLLEFKKGAVKLAYETGVPILPVTIRGANRVWAQGQKKPGLGKVEIIYHPLFKVNNCPDAKDISEHLHEENDRLKEIIGSAL